MKYKFGEKIRKIRIQKGIKQGELAQFLKITQSAYSKLENDITYITVEQLINIAYYTKVAITEFFPDDSPNLQQIDFRIQLQDLQNEIAYQKDLNKELMLRNKNIYKQLKEKKIL